MFKAKIFNRSKNLKQGDAYFRECVTDKKVVVFLKEEWEKGNEIPNNIIKVSHRHKWGGTHYFPEKLIGKEIYYILLEDYDEYRRSKQESKENVESERLQQ